jgi:hypothetical protein
MARFGGATCHHRQQRSRNEQGKCHVHDQEENNAGHRNEVYNPRALKAAEQTFEGIGLQCDR